MATQAICFEKIRCVGLRSPVIALCLVGSLSQVSVADEDAYLSQISSEAKKIDAELPAAEQPAQDSQVSVEAAAQQAFEEDLKARYMGSYTFYQKLPGRAREEVYEEYRDGASIDEIRKKIMSRFLNQ